ncbi:MAG: DNA-binding protein [Bdellovibrionales bacterium CG12_big_fil_rev_8_21_14_0_65_38_15]|nr:MAG: DNA-binding protein [Bdellovibrionales bacterium CG22_combo_CG10-13_8_21_14_all_38_13]PIQ52392.1 MAG: DNA-binding protein [Bdellovibrionales bacterium CG12_big_fil_rev_8_21_14_0_65_38_15]PIR29431.1 MAG: DNA-binding protein [Bdellovibrionales bacterium CG11_big_fil_rev_8_21_14_0_20_38_13]
MSDQLKLISQIENMIYVIRGQRVMLDSDLARLYGVENKLLKRAVRRNLSRFPEDFMFELNNQEVTNLRYQFGTSSLEHGGTRYAPMVFTENGVAMLSSVLNSEQAVQVNIAIMRIFTKLRSFLLLENDLKQRMDKLEVGSNHLFKIVFERLDDLDEKITPVLPGKRSKIGIKKG